MRRSPRLGRSRWSNLGSLWDEGEGGVRRLRVIPHPLIPRNRVREVGRGSTFTYRASLELTPPCRKTGEQTQTQPTSSPYPFHLDPPPSFVRPRFSLLTVTKGRRLDEEAGVACRCDRVPAHRPCAVASRPPPSASDGRQPRHTALPQCRGLRRPRRFGNVALARTRWRLIMVEWEAR